MKKALKNLFEMSVIIPLALIAFGLILWAMFCFLIWDMGMFLTFFSGGKSWDKVFFVWRAWSVIWTIISFLIFFEEMVEE